MKTVQKGSLVKRVDDDTARNLVSFHGFNYCPKSYWKKADANDGKSWRTAKAGGETTQ